jgi:hypothetical protein
LLIVGADKSLAPYGIDSPREFFRHTAAPIVTARLDAEGESSVLIARVRDEESLKISLRKRFGSRTEKVGSQVMLIHTTNEMSEAAVIINGQLLMGDADGVRRCLIAHDSGQSLADTHAFKNALASIQESYIAGGASVVSFGEQHATARASIGTLANLINPKAGAERRSDSATFAGALDEYAYSLGETRIVENGFERRTRSNLRFIRNVACRIRRRGHARRAVD